MDGRSDAAAGLAEPSAAALATLLKTHRRRLVARLARSQGIDRWGEAEDAVQAATLKALQHWPRDGVPANPLGWLYRVACRAAIDQWRAAGAHETPLGPGDDGAGWGDPEGALQGLGVSAAAPEPLPLPAERFSTELSDDELATLFAACHPALPPATQVALAVRAATDVNLATLAAAMLTEPQALAQRLARARQSLRGVAIEIPAGADLPPRVEAVLTATVSIFQIGWRAGAQDPRALAWEAIRLARALAAHPATACAEADAVAALLLLHGARLSGRHDDAGDIVPLPGQARDRWDAGLLRLGFAHLQRSQRATCLSRWHLQAGIAAEHAAAPAYAATAWPRIVAFYDQLVALDPSPAPRLAHAIARVEAARMEAGQVNAQQVERGLADLDALLPQVPMALKPHALAARAEGLWRLGRADAALHDLREAVAACADSADRRWLARRLADWEQQRDAGGARFPGGPHPNPLPQAGEGACGADA